MYSPTLGPGRRTAQAVSRHSLGTSDAGGQIDLSMEELGPGKFEDQQDGSHEPECNHVLGLRVQTSAIGKRSFVCMHRAVHKETTNQHNNITTSTTKSQPAQQYHQRNEIATKSPAQRNHQRNNNTSTTKSPTQQHHQHSNITSTTRSPPPATLHTLPTAHSTLHTLHSTLYTFHSTLCTLHFTLHTPHSTLYTLHFTLYT